MRKKTKMYVIECVKCGAPAHSYMDAKTGYKIFKIGYCKCGGFFSPNFSKPYYEEDKKEEGYCENKSRDRFR